MGLYIDMEMPKNCAGCFLRVGQCSKRIYMENRPSDCPLIPVPPLGRLGDLDALVEDLKRQCEEVFKIDAVSPDDFWITRDQAYNERLWKTWCESFFEYLKTRETIIPESEEG